MSVISRSPINSFISFHSSSLEWAGWRNKENWRASRHQGNSPAFLFVFFLCFAEQKKKTKKKELLFLRSVEWIWFVFLSCGGLCPPQAAWRSAKREKTKTNQIQIQQKEEERMKWNQSTPSGSQQSINSFIGCWWSVSWLMEWNGARQSTHQFSFISSGRNECWIDWGLIGSSSFSLFLHLFLFLSSPTNQQLEVDLFEWRKRS